MQRCRYKLTSIVEFVVGYVLIACISPYSWPFTDAEVESCTPQHSHGPVCPDRLPKQPSRRLVSSTVPTCT